MRNEEGAPTAAEKRTPTGASPRAGRVGRALLLGLVQAVVVVGGAGYAAYRYHEIQSVRQPPEPRNEPVRYAPRHSQPDALSDAELQRVLRRLTPRLRAAQPKINHVDHALRFWGVAAAFEEAECLSGSELRELLLDHRAFASAWGPQTRPFLIPDTRGEDLLDFRTGPSAAAASHIDHTLAGLAEVGTPLDFPIVAPRGETTLRAALQLSLQAFSLNQEEYEWSALAYLHYLPHVRQWCTTEGQIITWDRLAERLMRQRLAQGVCFGQHRLYALAVLLQADAAQDLLTPAARTRVVAHLSDATARLTATQHADGYWDGGWPGMEADGPPSGETGPLGAQADRLLATGHVLEWWAYAPPEALPPPDVLRRAQRWLLAEIDGLTAAQVRSYYPFLTHAGRALALWHGVEPHAALSRGE